MSARFASFREFYPFYLSEHRNPTCATFSYPAWSLAGDWVMYWQLLTGKIAFEKRNPGTGQGADSA